MDIKRAVRNGLINLGMQVFPIGAALVMVPFTIGTFGKEAFSLFSLGVTTVVLFNYMNFGVAQAATRALAKLSPRDDADAINTVFYSGVLAILGIGALFAILGLCISQELAMAVVNNRDPSLVKAASIIFRNILLASPIFLAIIYLRGCLESQHLFKYTAANRAILNSVIFLSPLVPAWLGYGVETAVFVILVAHLLSLAVMFAKTRQSLAIDAVPVVTKDALRTLLVSGGWMTISSLASMLLLYADRFLISNLVGLTAVAYYVAANDLVSRLSIIYGSITAAFYPAISRWSETGEDQKIASLVMLSNKAIYLVMMMLVLTVSIFSKEIMGLWISADYAEHAATLLSVLAFGILFNAMAITPFRTLLALGQERSVGIYFLAQSTVYLIVSYGAIAQFGAMGAAVTFVVRGAIEMAVLTVLLHLTYLKQGGAAGVLSLLPSAIIALLGMFFSLRLLAAGFQFKVLMFSLIAISFLLVFFFWFLTPQDRSQLSMRLKAFRA